MNLQKWGIRAFISLLIALCAQTSYAYSILAHEALIDSCWASCIQPLLLAKYPGATKAQLKRAHAYAYGGAIAPDIGYFPFGNPFFTNLVHYVRSGDFVNALLDDARNIDEYAFALGFLSHYMADKYGHSLATNKSVPMLYPKERSKFGDYVTYEEDHLSHKRVEFGFDALQSIEGDYAAIAYHDFIGFRIAGSVLARAFSEVYGLDIHKVFFNFWLSIEMLRLSFKRLFPVLTGAAWILKKKQLKKASSGSTGETDAYSAKNADRQAGSSSAKNANLLAGSSSAENANSGAGPGSAKNANLLAGSDAANNPRPHAGSGREKRRAGIFYGFFSPTFSGIFAIFIEFVPKIGPLRPMKFKAPGPVVANLYYSSFDTTVHNFSAAMRDCRSGTSRLPNIDFDTGNPTTPGEYGLADKNYDLLVVHLEKNKFKLLSSELRKNIIDFYSHRVAPTGSRKTQHAWARTETALHQLRQAQTAVAE